VSDPGDVVMVATIGNVDRTDRCGMCGWPMLYRVQDSTAGSVLASFCANEKCNRFIIEIPE
jgi:hypothetical protein